MYKKIIEKSICEIRFKPDSTFLDKRGQIANRIAEKSIFTDWNITANQIEFTSSSNKNIKANFSYRNLALESAEPNKRSFLIGNIKSFLEKSWDLLPNSNIIRIGVRSTYIIESDNFKEIFELLKEKFFVNNSTDFSGYDLYDLAISFNFVKGENYFHVSIGPMNDAEIKNNFNDEAGLPKAGLFMDIDSFKKTVSPHITQKEIMSQIKDLFNNNETEKNTIIKKIWPKE